MRTPRILLAVALVATAGYLSASAQQRTLPIPVETLTDETGSARARRWPCGSSPRSPRSCRRPRTPTTSQRDARVLRAPPGYARGARHRHARRRRTERDWSRTVRRARHPPDRGTAGRAPVRRRRAVLHPRGGLRLLVQPRRDDRRNGAGRRSSATSCGSSGRCAPTSSRRWASAARAEASTTRHRRC